MEASGTMAHPQNPEGHTHSHNRDISVVGWSQSGRVARRQGGIGSGHHSALGWSFTLTRCDISSAVIGIDLLKYTML
ncbi:unnamed protein product [Onchocerca flexuosa]|uniref:Uncharacterized protein n=1 Tax=Onchocerca flexuosa TaxID=387005 RepID=A0A183H459_9BILA|nr:unnamed protein product [Onchocerca flexuosa]